VAAADDIPNQSLAALFGNGDAFNSPFESRLFETKTAMFKPKS
jgi:hypothetical protein